MVETNTTGRLPDFVFERRRDIELEGNFELAGILITDIPNGRKPTKRDRQFIRRTISQLGDIVKNKPDLFRAGIWRTAHTPPDGLRPPFDERLLEERSLRCLTIMITSGSQSVVKVPNELLR